MTTAAAVSNEAVIFTAPGEVTVRELPVATPAAGEVLVRTLRSAISAGTELSVLRGNAEPGTVWADLTVFPQPAGYSNVGRILSVGAGVDACWVGRRVHCHGRHQSYAIAPAAKVTAVPKNVSSDVASLATFAKIAMNGLRRGAVTWGECVVVTGLGVIGQMAARFAAHAGARCVLAADPVELRRHKLTDGGDFQILPADRPGEWIDEIRAANHGRLADVVIETSGNPEAMRFAPRCVRPMGRVVVVSSPRGPVQFDFHDLCNRNSISIIGAHSSLHPAEEHPATPWTSRRHGELFLDLAAEGRLAVDSLITHRFSYSEAAAAYDLLLNRAHEALGVLFVWD